MINIEVAIDLYTAGNDNSQKRATKNGFLDIKDKSLHHLEFDNNHSGYPPDSPDLPHIIQFKLAPPDLTFCALDDDKTPGFIWIGAHPGAIMDVTRDPSGRVITILNHHRASHPSPNHTSGHWHYQLFAKSPSDDIYGIPWTSCNGPGDSNPSIKNR